MSGWLSAVTLTGEHASLVPLDPAHAPDLSRAAADLQGLWYTMIPTPEGMDAEIDRRLALQEAGTMLPFAILTPQGRAIGMTTYMNVEPAHRRVEIGSTWLARKAQRSPVNTECKLMLLRHAFETLDCIAVEFRTHYMNVQSRRAIERLGAKLDAVLRSHMIMADGSIRDTACYSIIASEWPAVRSNLFWQLQRPRT